MFKVPETGTYLVVFQKYRVKYARTGDTNADAVTVEWLRCVADTGQVLSLSPDRCLGIGPHTHQEDRKIFMPRTPVLRSLRSPIALMA